MPVGNPSQEENDRPVNLPIRTKNGQEAMDPAEEPSGEKIRSTFIPLQSLLPLILSQQERAEETSEREGTGGEEGGQSGIRPAPSREESFRCRSGS